jgi:flavin reductase (DIM6/NTAB) family NADH-FMN oxidoreductase RutF
MRTSTQPPSHLWKPGDPVSAPESQILTFDPTKIGQKATYKLLIGSIVPRPIAFISTISSEGLGNLAPFSFFNGVSSNPPAVMIAITRKSNGEKKDTLRNIESTREFVINTVSDWIVGPMNHCSADYPYGVDEMEKVGLTPVASQKVRPPRVQESPIQFECELYNTMEVGDGSEGSSTIVVGKIVCVHVSERVYDNGKIKIEELQPISRLGGLSYGRVSGVFEIPRPKV